MKPPFKGCPPVCGPEHLPAFTSIKACFDFHEKHAPGTHMGTPYECKWSGEKAHFHYRSTARRKAH